MKKRIFIAAGGVGAIAIAVVLLLAVTNNRNASSMINSYTVSSGMPTIVLDAGHGEPDGGAVASDGTLEKDLNFQITMKLKAFFLAGGFDVVMTRQDDNMIYDDETASLRDKNTSDLRNRLKIAESQDNAIFLSIHQNMYSESQYWGAQMFYSPNDPDSKVLGESIRSQIQGMLQPENNRELKKMDSSVYIIYNASMPAVLVECGFMSNYNELQLLQNDEYQTKLAYSIYCGVLEYLSAAEAAA